MTKRLPPQRAVASGADFSKSVLRGADFSAANLYQAKFKDAVLGIFDGIDTNFRGANCSHALFAFQGRVIKPPC